MTSPKNPIHIKLLNFEAIDSKRDLLFSEESILKILQALQNYKNFRMEELKIKSELSSNLKKVNSLINSLQKKLPKFKTPKKLKKFENSQRNTERKKSSSSSEVRFSSNKKSKNNALDSQLEEIRLKIEKLNK